MPFTNQIIIVTGSTRGIGKEIAKTFAKCGATVIILGRNAAAAQETCDELVKEGLKADNFACDVTNGQNVQEIINKILDKHKSIDILVNNAGITKDGLLLRMSEDDWDQVIGINLKGVFNCSKAVKILAISFFVFLNWLTSLTLLSARSKFSFNNLAFKSLSIWLRSSLVLSCTSICFIPLETDCDSVAIVPLLLFLYTRQGYSHRFFVTNASYVSNGINDFVE